IISRNGRRCIWQCLKPSVKRLCGMSPEFPPDFGKEFLEAGSLRRGHLCYFPVVPGRMEFAIEVRRAILDQRPSIVAVELPVSLERHYLRAVGRLPELTVLIYA